MRYRYTLTIEVDAEDESEAEARIQEKMDEYMDIMAHDGLLGCGRLEQVE